MNKSVKELIDSYAALKDFAIWMTGCCEMTHHEYFIKNRHLLSEPPYHPDSFENQWIPVSERLPEKQGKYLVYCPRGEYGKVYSAEFISVFHTGDEEVTHWQPLPKEPDK